MVEVSNKRLTAELEGSFVVFLIGARFNKWWKLHKVMPVAAAMGRMLREIDAHPEIGCLGYTRLGRTTFVQYWRSFDHLEDYARRAEREHWPAWGAFNERFKHCREDLGIWHETYLIEPGQYECIYSGMPPFGLGQVGRLVPATGSRNTGRDRLHPTDSP